MVLVDQGLHGVLQGEAVEDCVRVGQHQEGQGLRHRALPGLHGDPETQTDLLGGQENCRFTNHK